MNTFAGMSAARLAELVGRFPQLRVAVLGDYFLDKYLEVEPALAEVSIETGRQAHQVVNIRHSPGAAGTVVSNLAALGTGTLHAVGLTGDDGEGYELRKDLVALRCCTAHLHVDPRRTPTYLKPLDVTRPGLAGEHDRYDTKNRQPTSPETQARIIGSVEALLPEVDAVALMDQVEEDDCGVLTSAVVAAVTERATRWPKVVFWADSRRRIHLFRHVHIKPNQFEAVGRPNPAPGDEVALDELQPALVRLRQHVAAPIVVTRGAAGMVVSDPEPTLVPGVSVAGPLDPTGAGDSATAGCLLALAAGATLPEAALIGNLVASITVEQLATTGTARPEQLGPRLALWGAQRGIGG